MNQYYLKCKICEHVSGESDREISHEDEMKQHIMNEHGEWLLTEFAEARFKE